METSPAEVRHSIRGTFNALKLCVSALEMPMESSERLEFLADIDSSAENLVSLLDRYEASSTDAPPAPLQASAAAHVGVVAALKTGS